jgi:hypothetical protein
LLKRKKEMTIEQLMIDAIDMHVHGAPEPIEGKRRVDTYQLAQQAKEAGMKAVVIKSQRFGTGTLTWLVNRLVNSPILVGALCLNRDAGGLDPDIVEAQARAGAKVVWLPTISAAAHPYRVKTKGKDADEGISIIDAEGKLIPAMKEVLEVIRKNKMVLATGHVSKREVFAIAGEALRQHVGVIITHPMAGPTGPLITIEEAKELAAMGAYLEFLMVFCMPRTPAMLMSPGKMAESIKIIGPEHCILGTDFGQDFNPPPTEGFRMMLATMLKAGLTEDDLKLLVKVNPAKLLGL